MCLFKWRIKAEITSKMLRRLKSSLWETEFEKECLLWYFINLKTFWRKEQREVSLKVKRLGLSLILNRNSLVLLDFFNSVWLTLLFIWDFSTWKWHKPPTDHNEACCRNQPLTKFTHYPPCLHAVHVFFKCIWIKFWLLYI